MEAAAKPKETKPKPPKPKASVTPRIAVELPVESQKKSFSLKAPTVKLLADYAAFLSAHYGLPIDEDRVLEGAIALLAKDRAFAAWRKGDRNA